MPRDLDEDDVRSRPARSSRPRTRRRPEFADAVDARVIGVDRGRFDCVIEERAVVAIRSSALRRTAVVVGDMVSLVGAAGADDLARIVRVHPRTSVLRRTPDDADPAERVIVANADLLVVVVATADPEPNARFIDRCLVAAYDGGLAPLLCVTKSDLADPAPLLDRYRALAVPGITTSRATDDRGYAELVAALRGNTSVLIGPSGVGKSTLVNRLVPDADRAVGGLDAHGRGRHTSSSVLALPLRSGGWVIDTPGLRSFGLGLVDVRRVLRAFPDLAPLAENCPKGCSHLPGAEGCALDAGTPERVDSFRRLLESRTAPE
jgi:ribosome biogenesis GTPase